jgi:hypothetical protein
MNPDEFDEFTKKLIAQDRTPKEELAERKTKLAAAGTPIPIEPEHAKATRDQVGSAAAGYFSFKPLFDVLVKEQPDFLE